MDVIIKIEAIHGTMLINTKWIYSLNSDLLSHHMYFASMSWEISYRAEMSPQHVLASQICSE